MAKTIALISETISANCVSQLDRTSWHKTEIDWFNKFCLSFDKSNHPLYKTDKRRNNWKLRGTKEEVNQWILDQKQPTVQFDGASKNNLGKAGAGGVIRDQYGKVLITYEWGLGKISNNKAEAYSLLLGTTILKKMSIQSPIILGDSAILIAAMTTGGEFKKKTLSNIKHRIMDNISNLGDATFKHVMKANNSEVDCYANRATNRPTGQVRENDITYEKPIP